MRFIGPTLALAAVPLFGEEAKMEAKEAQEKGYQSRGNLVLKTAQGPTTDYSGRWCDRVAQKANNVGLNIKPSGVRAIQEAMDAP